MQEHETMECLLCKLVRGEIDSAKLWENDYFIAVLDLFPNVKGQTLLITKKHYPSDFFNQMPQTVYENFLNSTRDVIQILKTGLNVHRVSLVIEGMGIDHAHIKLYPLHGLTQNFQEMWYAERIYFERYQGYISTQLGPKADIEELKRLANFINQKTEH